MNPGTLRLLHLREQTEAAGETLASERGRFGALADPASAPRIVSAFNLFQTPPELADRMMGYLLTYISPGDRILEPSAGLGRLYLALRTEHAGPVVMVEQSPECCRELYDMTNDDYATKLIQGDFLTKTAEDLGGRFDGILMNPPFKQWRDIKHIDHARKLLRPGGRLVALCANGPRQQAKLTSHATAWIDLPAQSFASEGTNVETAIVIIDA